MADTMGEVLTDEHALDYPYARSVGPVLGAFFTGLREGRVLGVRASGGTVIVPPAEYDPQTAEPTGELVEVGPGGVVESWAWVAEPLPQHPLDRPFAWALVRLDGAGTALLHVLDAGSPEAVHAGMRVTVDFVPEADRVGQIQDIRAFVPENTSTASTGAPSGQKTAQPGVGLGTHAPEEGGVGPPSGQNDIVTIATPMHLDYRFTAGVAQSRYLRGLMRGKFIGARCPVCRKVYVPSRGSCPVDGVATTEEVELGNRGTVTTFCVVNVPFAGQSIELPYICAQILLDGANISFMGLIQEIPADQVRMGLRVEAVWVPPEELKPTLASVKYFRPTGEPDADYETFKEYL